MSLSAVDGGTRPNDANRCVLFPVCLFIHYFLLIDVSCYCMTGNKFASGAHSRIYRGIYKQRAVAVKMVRIPTHKEETRVLLEQQFKSEVALLSRFYHPNIVQVRLCTHQLRRMKSCLCDVLFWCL